MSDFSLQKEAMEKLALVLVFIYQHLPKTNEEDVFSVVKSMSKDHDEKIKAGIKTVILNFASNETYIPAYQIMDLVSNNVSFKRVINAICASYCYIVHSHAL